MMRKEDRYGGVTVHERMICIEDEDPPSTEKWVMMVKKRRGRKRRIVQRFKTSRLVSLLRYIKVRSSSRWDGFLSW